MTIALRMLLVKLAILRQSLAHFARLARARHFNLISRNDIIPDLHAITAITVSGTISAQQGLRSVCHTPH